MDNAGAEWAMLFLTMAISIGFLTGTPLEDLVFIKGAASLVLIPLQFFVAIGSAIPFFGPLVYYLAFSVVGLKWMNSFFGDAAVGLSIVALVAMVAMTHTLNFL